MSFVSALPLLAAVFAVPQFVPQLARLWRTGDPAGMSAGAFALTSLNNLAWLTYFVSQGHVGAIVPNGSVIAMTAAVVILLARVDVPVRGALLATAGWAIVLATALAWGGPTVLGAVLTVAFALQSAPAVWAAHRTADPSGVSSGTWWLVGAELTCWGTFGLAQGDPTVIALGATGLVIAGLMIVRTSSTRDRSTRQGDLEELGRLGEEPVRVAGRNDDRVAGPERRLA